MFDEISAEGGMQWRSCLRHCATSWKVAVSIGIILPATLGSLGTTQSLTEMSKKNISWE